MTLRQGHSQPVLDIGIHICTHLSTNNHTPNVIGKLLTTTTVVPLAQSYPIMHIPGASSPDHIPSEPVRQHPFPN